MDEPTEGLDEATKTGVLEALRAAADVGAAVVIATHDSDVAQAGFVAQLYRFNRGRLARGDASTAGSASRGAAEVAALPSSGSPGIVDRLWDALVDLGRALWRMALLPAHAALPLLTRQRFRFRWFCRYCLSLMAAVMGLSSVLYVAVGGALLGFSSLYFSTAVVEQHVLFRELLTPELLGGIGFTLYRVIVPLVVALLIAAKAGSAVAGDFGQRAYGGQLTVMRTLNASPESYLLVAAVIAFAIGTPALEAIAFLVARAAAFVAYVSRYPGNTWFSWHHDFHSLLVEDGRFLWKGTFWKVGKLAASGAGIGAICYGLGARPKASVSAVSGDISLAALFGSLFTLLVFALFAFVEFA
jgi:phospholipid/cholesterol/gamma-HCH transport system permease protein